MAIPVLLILVALWGIFFLWPLVAGRFRQTGGRALASVDRFRHGIGSIGRSGGHALGHLVHHSPVVGPVTPNLGPLPGMGRPPVPARRRRRQVLTVAGAASAVVLIAALAIDATILWALALLVCGPSLAYLAAVVRLEQAQRERALKVRPLPAIEPPSHRVEPPAAMRRTIAQQG